MDSVEELWRIMTEEELRNVDKVVEKLIKIINQKLKERKSKVGG